MPSRASIEERKQRANALPSAAQLGARRSRGAPAASAASLHNHLAHVAGASQPNAAWESRKNILMAQTSSPLVLRAPRARLMCSGDVVGCCSGAGSNSSNRQA